MKKILTIILVVFFICCTTINLDAKTRSGSFGFNSTSRISSPKPSIPKLSTTRTITQNSLNVAQKPNVTRTTPRSGSFGSNSTKQYHSQRNYDVHKEKFKKQNPVKSDKIVSYTPQKDTGFYTNPPTYVYQTAPSFGMWDTMFLMYMLNSTQNQAWMYHHQDDTGVKEFKKELDELSKTNEELKKKNEELDATMKKMKEENIQPNKNYEPKDMEPVEITEKESWWKFW